MDEEGEEPFVALDSLLEVNLVEDTTAETPTLGEGDPLKDGGLESRPNRLGEDPVNSNISYVRNTGLDNCVPDCNLDPIQIAWGMDLEEDTFYKDLFKDVSTVRFLRLHCTVCDTHLGCKPGSVLMRHVRLGTLLCKDCFTFYGAGEFPVAEDGSESFCCWCGQGGSVICCSSCSAVFCKKCIKLNYTKSTIKEIETSPEWMCFVCNYRSLWEHRAVCRAAITYESSDHVSLKGDEENETPGHNQEFCCGPTVERRIPRLKSNMPSEVTFGEYIKAGRVKASVMKMLRNITVDSNEDFKTENTSADTQKTLTHSAASEEIVSSEQTGAASNSNKERVHASMASHNISYIGVGPLINQAHFSSINSQPTAGLPFLNHGIRPNILSNNQIIPSGRVVVMPPVHIPHRTSVIRFPQQNSPADSLSLGALLNSSPPVGSVSQQPNPMFRFQSGTSPLVVVRKSSGAYVPVYVNNSASLHYIPKESSQISGVPHYVQNHDTNAITSQPNQQQEKPENSIKFAHNSTINNAAPHQSNINGHTSENMSATLACTAKTYAKSTVNTKSKTQSRYIQVRSPTALQSVRVSDIEHSPLAVSESLSSVSAEQQSIHNSLLPDCPSGTVPSAPTSLARDQSMLNSLLTDHHSKKYPQNKPVSGLTSSTASLEATSVLKNILTDVLPDSSNPVNGTSSNTEVPQAADMNQTCPELPSRREIPQAKAVSETCPELPLRSEIPQGRVVNQTCQELPSMRETPQACVVNQTCPELPSSNIDAIEINWFKENLLAAENVAKYMLTRITCIQEELDSKPHQKQAYDDMINNFNKFLEIASKKLTDVNRSFTANLQRWKAHLPSSNISVSQELCANTDKQSSGESMNGHNNTLSHEDVEVISEKVSGKRKRSNSGLEISLPVTSTVNPRPGSAVVQDATSSDTCTDSSQAATQVAKPINTTYQPTRMFTRRSTATKSAVKCCSSCEPDQQLHSKLANVKQNMRSSRIRPEKLEQDKCIHIPEKKRKLKDLRIVLERIQNPGKIVFKREENDNHSTNDSSAQSLETVAVVKDQSHLGVDDLVKQLKPCYVVIHRLNQSDITQCI
ncbi:uncharacterized protein LOC124787731 [Schistocerca piceifrons]|uniref:uncharacterized protein LOC124787731 n=1 Tax=Schistocerca piceifrons TaxID=274613 RepID=UPI001F5E8A25|nr:uncharacterized protein LOC124787731 [Schistocerca piceifrons]XP_047110535.1 uncharacterized protein LOC124787731 [Schistocerca piceifrons]